MTINDWYCDQNGSQSDMKDWEKSAIVAGLMLLLREGEK